MDPPVPTVNSTYDWNNYTRINSSEVNKLTNNLNSVFSNERNCFLGGQINCNLHLKEFENHLIPFILD